MASVAKDNEDADADTYRFCESTCECIMGGQGWGDDIILRRVLSFGSFRVRLRAVTSRWLQLIESRFPPPRKFDPPQGCLAFIELEQDLQLNKLIYSATLRIGHGLVQRESADQSGYMECGKLLPSENAHSSGQYMNETASACAAAQPGRYNALQPHTSTVAFMNWVPSYYRSNTNDDREMVHELEEEDAIAIWIFVTKLLCQGERDASRGTGAAAQEESAFQNRETCIACSGNGCRICGGTGIRPGAPTGTSVGAVKTEACRGFLWVRCGGSDGALCSSSVNEGADQPGPVTLARKHAVCMEELSGLQNLLDHRRNLRLRCQERAPARFVPFGGVSNV